MFDYYIILLFFTSFFKVIEATLLTQSTHFLYLMIFVLLLMRDTVSKDLTKLKVSFIVLLSLYKYILYIFIENEKRRSNSQQSTNLEKESIIIILPKTNIKSKIYMDQNIFFLWLWVVVSAKHCMQCKSVQWKKVVAVKLCRIIILSCICLSRDSIKYLL